MLVVTLDPSALSSSRNEKEEAVKIHMCIAKIDMACSTSKKNISSKFLGKKFSKSPLTSVSQLAMTPTISL